MKTVSDIARELAPHVASNNAAIGETNRRLVRLGDGQGNLRPATLLTPRDVLYRSDLDQNDRGVAILSSRCPIPLQSLDGYYDTECWLANVPGSSQPQIVDIADVGGFSTGGPTPMEAATNAAAFSDQSQIVLLRLRPSFLGGISVYIDVGPYAIAYEIPGAGMGYLNGTDFDFPDPADSDKYVPVSSPLALGEHRLIGIAFDPSTAKYVAIAGVATVAADALPSHNEFTVADYQAVDFTGYYPAGFVYSYYGQTDVVEDDCLRLFDPRLLMHLKGNTATSLAKYLLQQADAGLPNAQAMGALATGIVKNTITTGVQSIATGADLPVMTGDAGTGGAGGAVPAPGAGDAAAGKFLKADATWAVPPGGGAAISTNNVSNPPTDAELDTAFGTPATVGAGFLGLVNDNNAGTDEYLVWSDGANWFYVTGTKAT